MKLYIPEIGDHMVLTKDWTFTLHAESRNTDLAGLFGYYLYSYNSGWIVESEHPKMRDPDYNVPYPTDEEFKNFWGTIDYGKQRQIYDDRLRADGKYQQYVEDSRTHREIAEKICKKDIEITLKKGTILSVDRIYIRKGSSDYSSITFYAKNLGEVNVSGCKTIKKRKSFRFWVKLGECNKIEFEKTDKIK